MRDVTDDKAQYATADPAPKRKRTPPDMKPEQLSKRMRQLALSDGEVTSVTSSENCADEKDGSDESADDDAEKSEEDGDGRPIDCPKNEEHHFAFGPAHAKMRTTIREHPGEAAELLVNQPGIAKAYFSFVTDRSWRFFFKSPELSKLLHKHLGERLRATEVYPITAEAFMKGNNAKEVFALILTSHLHANELAMIVLNNPMNPKKWQPEWRQKWHEEWRKEWREEWQDQWILFAQTKDSGWQGFSIF